MFVNAHAASFVWLLEGNGETLTKHLASVVFRGADGCAAASLASHLPFRFRHLLSRAPGFVIVRMAGSVECKTFPLAPCLGVLRDVSAFFLTSVLFSVLSVLPPSKLQT